MMKLLQLTAVLFGVVVITGADPSPDTQLPPTPVCPPRDSPGFFCREKCVENADCGPNLFCCEVRCGKMCMTRYQHTQSPTCPPPNPLIRCFAFVHSCNNDQECKKIGPHGHCCLEPACGRHCDDTSTQH
nr:WAP four-disulfide core domain protein 2-like [Procambarus clarkii]